MNRAAASVSCVWREAPMTVSNDRHGEEIAALVPGMRTHLEGCPACVEEHDGPRELLMVLE